MRRSLIEIVLLLALVILAGCFPVSGAPDAEPGALATPAAQATAIDSAPAAPVAASPSAVPSQAPALPPVTPAPDQIDSAPSPTVMALATSTAQPAATDVVQSTPTGAVLSTPATATQTAPTAAPRTCAPTAPDALGPFYEPNAPERTTVGSGYVLAGQVLAADGCRPLPNARVEFWMANPQGDYDDAHRATVVADAEGRYRFESNIAVPYGGRPPHIHVRVEVDGYTPLVTQHYPKPGETQANFDLVLSGS